MTSSNVSLPGRDLPDGKKNSDQTYSCPRDWRLSAINSPPATSRTIDTALYRIEGVKGHP